VPRHHPRAQQHCVRSAACALLRALCCVRFAACVSDTECPAITPARSSTPPAAVMQRARHAPHHPTQRAHHTQGHPRPLLHHPAMPAAPQHAPAASAVALASGWCCSWTGCQPARVEWGGRDLSGCSWQCEGRWAACQPCLMCRVGQIRMWQAQATAFPVKLTALFMRRVYRINTANNTRLADPTHVT